MAPATPIVVADGADADGEGGGALHVLISLSWLRSGFLGAVRIGWRGSAEEREEVGRGCTIADPPILSSSTRNGSWRYGSCGTGHLLVKRSHKQLLSTNLRRPIGSPTATSVQNRDPSFS